MLRKFFAGILVTIFLFFSFPLLTVLGVYNTITHFDSYSPLVYKKLYDNIIYYIPKQIEYDETFDLEEEEFRNVIIELFPKEQTVLDFSAIFEDLKNQIFNPKFNEDDFLRLKINTDFILQKKNEIITSISQLLYEKLPICDSIPDPNNIDCVPEDFSYDQFLTIIKPNLDSIFEDNVPSHFEIKDIAITDEEMTIFNNFMENIKYIPIIIIIFLGIILVLIGFLIYRPIGDVLVWMSSATLPPSIILTLIIFILWRISLGFSMNIEPPFIEIPLLFLNIFCKKMFMFLIPMLILSGFGLFYGISRNNELN